MDGESYSGSSGANVNIPKVTHNQQKQIPEQFSMLFNSLDENSALVDDLLKRLTPITGHVPLDVDSDTIDKELVEVADQIRAARRRIEDNSRMLQKILSHLEL